MEKVNRNTNPAAFVVGVCAAGVGLGLAILFGVWNPRAQAAAVTGLTRRPLLNATLENGKMVASVQSAQIDFLPGQATGPHQHPIPVVGLVTRGAFQFQVAAGPSRTLTAGSAFYEPANTGILRFDNASDKEPASIVAFYLMGKNDRELISVSQ